MPSAPPRPLPATPARLALYNFTSRWFLIPQGTGITAVILHQLDYQFRGLQIISYVFWITTIILLLSMVLVYATRCILFPQKVTAALGRDMDELACINSITISSTSIIQMMAVTLVQGWGKGWGVAVYVLWWINVAMAVLGTAIIPFIFMRIYPTKVRRLSPTARLPLIAALTAAAGGGTICQYAELNSELQVPVIVVSYLLVGAALPLAFALDAFVWHRIFDGSVPDEQITFQEMIKCGPWGQGSFALQGLGVAVLHGSFANYGSGIFLTAKAAEPVGYASIFAGLLAWGMGTFWWTFAILSIAHAAIDSWRWRGIPFSLATWSVVFPWGVYTNAALQLGKLLDSTVFKVWSTVLAAMLVTIWLLNISMTIKGVITGSLLGLDKGWSTKSYQTQDAEGGKATSSNGKIKQ